MKALIHIDVYCFVIVRPLLLVAALIVVSTPASAEMIIMGGRASAAADMGTSFDQSRPPGSFTPNVFYDFRDLPGTASGTLGAGGWANISWNVSGGINGRITVAGGSGEGYNGTYTETGWLYGRGHADFTMTFTLNSDYLYETTGTIGNTSGVGLGKGALRAGTHTITVGSLGTNAGFNLVVNLTPFTGNILDILKNSVFPEPTDPNRPDAIFVNFIPKGLALKQVADLLGVDHFNWVQEITHLPKGWSISMVNPNWNLVFDILGIDQSEHVIATAPFDANGNIIYGAALNPFGSKIYDPPIDSTSFRYIVNRPGQHSFLIDPVETGTPGVIDNRPYYWGEDASRSGQNGNIAKHDKRDNGTRLSFSDRPTLAADAPAGEYVGFALKLVGVAPDGREVSLPVGSGTTVIWESNAKGVANVMVLAIDAHGSPSPPILSGGVFNIRLDTSNAPPTFTLNLATPAIVGVSIPVNSQDGSQPRTDNVWSVTVPPYPFSTNLGIGIIINPVFPMFDFALHNHAYLSSQVPDPARAMVTYEFDHPAVVNELEVIQHANGVTRIEGFIGDSLANLTSIGNVFGPRGDLAGSSRFTERESTVFQFTNVTAAKFFRFIIRKTSLGDGFALHRAYPRDPSGVRFIGAVAAPVQPSLLLNEDAGPQTVPSFANNISPGGANEAFQRVTFLTTNDNTALFSSQPEITRAGTLTFTPTSNAYGSAIVTVTARDDGGTDFGGSDTSAPQIFTVTVRPINDPPVPGSDSIIRLNSTTIVTVLKSELLANDSDAEGETLVIESVGEPMPPGADVVLAGDLVIYNAPNTNAGNGRFTYTINDGKGGLATTGLVNVVESPVLAPVMSARRSGSDYPIVIIGIPGQSYRVQYTTNTAPPYVWNEFAPLAIFSAPADGRFEHIDVNPKELMRLYRTLQHP